MAESPYFGSLVEVAAYFNRSPRTIRRWVKACRVPYFRTDGNHLLFRRDFIEAWVRSGYREPIPPKRTRQAAANLPAPKPSEPPKPPGQKRTRRVPLPPNIPAP